MVLGGFSGTCSCRVTFRAGAAPRATWASYDLVPGQRRGRGEGDGTRPPTCLRRRAWDTGGVPWTAPGQKCGVCRWVLDSPSVSPAPHLLGKSSWVPGPGKSPREGPEAARGFRPTRAGGAAPGGSLRTQDSEMRPTESCAHSDPFPQTGPIFGLKPFLKGAVDKAPLCSLSLRFSVNHEIGLLCAMNIPEHRNGNLNRFIFIVLKNQSCFNEIQLWGTVYCPAQPEKFN